MRKLQALLARRLGLTWEEVTEWLREVNGLDDLERRLATGRWNDLLVGVDVAGQKLATELHQAYVTAGQTEANWLDRQERLKDTLVRFDTGHTAVVQRQRHNELKLVQDLTLESRSVVHRVLVEGAQSGVNPREMARRVRDSIGLTDAQERWVSSYRRALEQQDWSRALGYELSSGNADRSVAAAQRRGVALTPERVNEMVAAYRQNAIAYRAETIARTEAMAAAEQGASDAMRQAVERGDVKAEEMIVTWHAGPGGKDARPDHQAMDGRTVKLNEDFVLPDGTRMSGPHDPRGSAKHNANCRCTRSVSFAL